MHKLIFLRHASCCSMYGGSVGYGLGWIMGPYVHLAVGWVGLGQLLGGLGWAGSMKIDQRTTLRKLYKRESGSKFDFGFRATKMVGNDSSLIYRCLVKFPNLFKCRNERDIQK